MKDHRAAAIFLLTLSLLSPAWGLSLREVTLKPQDLPPSCHSISGVYPAGVRTSMLYDYKRYAGAMPPLVQKTAQSFNCGGVSGSLLFFEYASAEDRDQAELFAKPILSREEDVSNPIEVREWSNGFVVVSFKNTPPELSAALEKKLVPGSVSTAAREPLPTPPVVAPAPQAAPATTATTTTALPLAPVPPVPVNSVSAALPAPTTAASVTPSLDQMATPKPAAPLSAEPPMDAAHAVNAARVVAPMTRPVPVMEAPPPKRVVSPSPARIETAMATPVQPPTVKPRPPSVSVPTPVITPKTPPPASPKGAAVRSLTDVSDSVLVNFATKLDCANPDLKEQGRMVCAILDDFKNGEKPVLPQALTEIILGPVYTIDPYGRLVDRHHDVIVGTDWPGYLSFFSLVSSNGQQDFEIQSLIDARKAQKPLPINGTLQTIHKLGVKKRFPMVPTNGPSIAILPGGPRRVFIRKTGDHWVLFGPQGATSDEQTISDVVLAELY